MESQKRIEQRSASILAAIYNTIPKKEGTKPRTPNDFLPESLHIKDKPRKGQTPEEMRAMVLALHYAHTGEKVTL